MKREYIWVATEIWQMRADNDTLRCSNEWEVRVGQGVGAGMAHFGGRATTGQQREETSV